jgi:hypothetical protein
MAATAATDAWAVGFTGATLTVHWDGTAWTQVPSPNPTGKSLLNGVATTAAANAWAVGFTGDISKPTTLILHWNGTAWK